MQVFAGDGDQTGSVCQWRYGGGGKLVSAFMIVLATFCSRDFMVIMLNIRMVAFDKKYYSMNRVTSCPRFVHGYLRI